MNKGKRTKEERDAGGGSPPDGLLRQLGYTFKDTDLLMEALTHRGFSEEDPAHPPDNQRLEFLGDAVLGLIIATELLERFPERPEGFLTKHRADLVNAGHLETVGQRLKLGCYLRLGVGEERTNGRNKPRLIRDALEALIGAVYRDGGLARAQELVLRLWEPDLSAIERGDLDGERLNDPKSLLQERLQRDGGPAPTYVHDEPEGPPHERRFFCEVHALGRVLARGTGASKQLAEKDAARNALKALDRPPGGG